jgi:hypothetical protein
VIWSVEWSNAIQHDIQRMHWRRAGRICRAVFVFAESGRGDVEDIGIWSTIRVSGAIAYVRFDEATRTVEVQRIYSTK